MKDVREILAACSNVLPGRGQAQPIAQTLSTLAAALDGHEMPDTYGEGEYLQSFESEVAAMFGKEAAVFMPSGTMAQQIALRVWCDRQGRQTVAMHPSAHLEFAEHLGYQHLHGIHRLQFGSPEFAADRMLTVQDFDTLAIRPGVALLELPYRPLGGQLNSWDELVAMRDWLGERAVPFHLDGARIWQCTHYYDRSLAEIGALFDSIYVSFYKDVGGMCGCMLLGDADFVAESRVWQRRYGGNLINQAPFYASARHRLFETLPLMGGWVARAAEVASVLNSVAGIRTNPTLPPVNFFQVFVEGEPDRLTDAHSRLADETGTFVFPRFARSRVPGLATTELHLWENATQFDMAALRPFLEQLMEESQ